MLQVANSNRLTFQLMTAEDAPLLFELDQDVEVMRYINGGTATSMQTIVEVLLPRMAKYYDPDRGFGIWQVRRQADNVYLGWVLIRPMGFNTESPSTEDLELGWRFKREYWGQGYATEAATAVANAVLTHNRQYQWLSAMAMPGNGGSIAVMKKLGMSFVKQYVHQDALGDVEVVLYRMASSAL